MKTRFLTANADIAAVAAFGGLIAISFFALFFEQHGIHLSIVALVISLWGFLSLKQMDTQQDTPKPKMQRRRKIGLTAALIVCIGGGLLFGTIKVIDATQTDTTPCLKWTRKDCPKVEQQPICPQQKAPCTLNAAAQSEQLYSKENYDE